MPALQILKINDFTWQYRLYNTHVHVHAHIELFFQSEALAHTVTLGVSSNPPVTSQILFILP